MKRITLKILSLIIIILLGCGVPPRETKTVMVLFDVSGSTVKERNAYITAFEEKILPKITHGDVIVADKITQASISLSELFVNKSFPSFLPDIMKNPRQVKREQEEADKRLKGEKEKIITTVRENILQGAAPYTDILSAMHTAERVFNSYPRDKKILVIFSDMVLETKNYNFTSDSISDTRIQEIISNEQFNKQLPNLSGVKVYVVGATAGNNNDRYWSIQNFWNIYFQECGANLSSYGKKLIIFDE